MGDRQTAAGAARRGRPDYRVGSGRRVRRGGERRVFRRPGPGGRLFLRCFSDEEPGEQRPRRVSKTEFMDAFAQGWVIESIESSRYEIRPDPNDISIRDGGPKAGFVLARRTG